MVDGVMVGDGKGGGLNKRVRRGGDALSSNKRSKAESATGLFAAAVRL
jgi:hypothetical protein